MGATENRPPPKKDHRRKAGPGVRMPLRPQTRRDLLDGYLGAFYVRQAEGEGSRFIMLSSRSPRTDLPQGLGLPTRPTSLDPSALPELNSSVDADIGMRRPPASDRPPGGQRPARPVVLLLEVAHHAARQGRVPVQSVLHRPPSSSFRKLMRLFFRNGTLMCRGWN